MVTRLTPTPSAPRQKNNFLTVLQIQGCMVVQLVALLPCSKKVLGSTHVKVLSGYSSFLPQSKNMTVRLIGFSKLNECVHGCLSCVSLCCPVMDWRPVQCVSSLSPVEHWK
ncbi:hypothetical protein CHARACLAT_030236 [Characodon lateralis]|uniref:Uncharacterized protein n=1 Tax=Characodon lateralis TaxID=208331 RepID=A0ABU7EY18_9TELE|nr:hypothetical protein [Characodon lateralis]